MDIFIQNVQDANHIELQVFLKEKLNQLGILAFEVRKHKSQQNGQPFAILTVASLTKGNTFLQYYGSARGRQIPLNSMLFRGKALRFQKSNRAGQPDPMKVRTLQEKEEHMAKRISTTQIKPLPRSAFPFRSLTTGTWEYDSQSKLQFDPNFTDLRQGYVTFGRTALVLYLQQGTLAEFGWHCRIDISHAIIEHVIPAFDTARRGVLIFTLKWPPKFYHIRSTNDLHLYSGNQAPEDINLATGISSLALQSKEKEHRLERLCALNKSNARGSALCMVYRIVFPDQRNAEYAFNFVNDFSVSEKYCWKTTMIHISGPHTTESQYAKVESALSDYHPSISPNFDFAVRFQLLALVLEGAITPLKMMGLIPLVQKMAENHGAELTAIGIKRLGREIPVPSPSIGAQQFQLQNLANVILRSIESVESQIEAHQMIARKSQKYHHLALTYKATVTPTGLFIRGPDWIVSNRILRKYSKHTSNFMTASFTDEDGLSLLHDPRASQEHVYERFRQVLCHGVKIAGKTFEFLGFSHASLRNHQAWFMAPFEHDGRKLCAKDVIETLGEFSHIHCSAKCAARIGQAFSDTMFSVPMPETVYVIETKEDVQRNGRCFSDGCGTASLDLIVRIWKALPPRRREQRPTVFQIRYRGAKGVLSLDASLNGEQLHIRKSMTKFVAKEGWKDLELCNAGYHPLTVFLNHQFVKILEDLGVSARNFLTVQEEAVNELKLITEHPLNAASFLEYSHSGVFAKVPQLFELMHYIGLSFHADRFLTDIVEVAAMTQLRSIKYRARIPVKKGYLLYGIMDETNTLREGEVYIAVQSYDTSGNQKRRILLGDRIIVTRAPALHPGDAQLVTAVDVPEKSILRANHNCIVFSQQGARDLPSQLSGGDLDGDLFHVIYDERLVPDFTVPAADYPSTLAKDLGRAVQREDIVDFFIEYMKMDRLGMISNKHKIRADLKPLGTRDPECILLAKLASDAVDFSKSGIPANMQLIPRGSDYIRPDFMAAGSNLVINGLGAAELEAIEQDDIDDPDSISILDPDKNRIRYYKSEKSLGILYRAIDEKKFFSKMKSDYEKFRNSWGGESLMQKLDRYIDRETQGVQWDHHWEFAEHIRQSYEDNMFEIMDTMRPHRGEPLTELEVFSGNILAKQERTLSRHTREANLEVQDRFNRDVSSIINRILTGDQDQNDEDAEALPRAIACFKVTLETEGWENYRSLKSWKYVAASVCLEQLWKFQGRMLRPL